MTRTSSRVPAGRGRPRRAAASPANIPSPAQPRPAARPLALALVLAAAPLVAPPWTAAALSAENPAHTLRAASSAYERSEFDKVVRMLGPLLEPRIQFSNEEQAVAAYRLLGLSYLFQKDEALAEKQFLALLALRPGFRLDPLVDPLAAVEFLEEIKRRNAEMVQALMERDRRERERRIQEELRLREEQRRLEEERRRAAALRPSVERTVVEHPLWVSFLPFGAGQFQNGHRVKGFVLLGLQAGLGALSLGTALALRVSYPDGSVPADEWDRAQALSVTQVAAGGAFFACVVYGVVDALVYHRARTVTERAIPPPASPGEKKKGEKEKKDGKENKEKKEKKDNKTKITENTRFFLTPAPGGGSAGLGLGLVF